MGVSSNLVEIINKRYGYNFEKVSDIFVGKSSIENSNLSMKNDIKLAKEKLIKFSDHDGDEEIIDLLMQLEINQESHLEKEKYLKNKIEKLEIFIEKLVDDYNVDLRDFRTSPLLARIDCRINDNTWLKVVKSRDRGFRLKGILENTNNNNNNKD